MTEPGLDRVIHAGYRAAGTADVFHRGPEGSARVDDPRRRHGAAGGRRHPHRFRERLHPRRDRSPTPTTSRARASSGAKEAGKMRLEGKEYVVKDGDVMHFQVQCLTRFGAHRSPLFCTLRAACAAFGPRLAAPTVTVMEVRVLQLDGAQAVFGARRRIDESNPIDRRDPSDSMPLLGSISKPSTGRDGGARLPGTHARRGNAAAEPVPHVPRVDRS